MQDNRSSEQKIILADAADAAVAYARMKRGQTVDACLDADSTNAMFAEGMADILYELTQSPDELRKIMSDAMARYDADELERENDMEIEYFEDKECGISDADVDMERAASNNMEGNL